MKKSRFFAVLFTLTLAAAPGWAQTDQAAAPQPQNQAPAQGTTNPGCRLMGGSGMGMGPGMMGGGMGMGRGMMGGGMGMGRGMMGGMGGGGMQPCMMGDCWQQRGMGMGMGMGRMGGMQNCPGPRQTVQTTFREINGYQMNAGALGLTDEQRQRLDEVEEALTTAAIKTRADLQIAAIDLRRAMAQENPDVAKAGNVIDRQGRMWTDLQKTAIKAVAEARRILTAQQRQKAKAMAAQAGPMTMPMPPMPDGQESGDMTGPEMHHGGSM